MVNGGSFASPEWFEISNSHFKISFRLGYDQDAIKIRDFANYAREIVLKSLPFYFQNNVTVHIHEYPLTINCHWLDWCVMRSDVKNGLIHMLSPRNAYQISTNYNDVWYRANTIHEYVHHVVAYHIRQTSGKDMTEFLPTWFSEGIAGYIPYYHSSLEIMSGYQLELDKQRELVRKGVGDFNCLASDVYFGGPILVEYMYDEYCESKVLALIGCKALNWEDAIKEELGITCKAFEDNWLQWSNKKFRL